MNCDYVALLLDDRDIRELSAREHETVHSHLRTCADCAAVWKAHERLLGRTIPRMRDALPQAVWQTVQTASTARNARRFGRPALVGFLIAGAAAAMLTLSTRENATIAADDSDVWGLLPNEIEARPARAATLAPFQGTVHGQESPARSALGSPLRKRLAMLPTRYEIDNQAARDDVDATRAAFVRFLRDYSDIEVGEISPSQEASVSVFKAWKSSPLSRMLAVRWVTSLGADPSLAREIDREVARHFGYEYSVRFTSSRRDGSSWHGSTARFNALDDGQLNFDPSLLESDPVGHGAALARRTIRKVSTDSAGALYARLLVDPRFSDRERLELLSEGVDGAYYPRFATNEFFAAAVEFARGAAEPATRREAWRIVGVRATSEFAQPLMDALRSEQDERVRQMVARSLGNYSRDPVVRAVLESAAAGDRSHFVRRQAQWIVLDDLARRALLETVLRDSTLPPEERVATLIMAHHRTRPIFDELAARNADATALLAAAARGSDDAQTRRDALNALGDSPAYVELLLEKLHDNDPAERRYAMRTLMVGHLDAPGVRDALVEANRRAPEEGFEAALRQFSIITPLRRFERFIRQALPDV